jgi:4-hydroxy-L-threonine phosphate dehydrogenase PdxA
MILAITSGEPAGVGPELCAALRSVTGRRGWSSSVTAS